MHNLEVFNLVFDINASSNVNIREIFKNRIATILWCSIKSGHIADQYFDQLILKVSKELENDQDSCNYQEFLKITSSLNNQFGRICVWETMFDKQFEIDHEFWSDIFKAIHNKRCFKIESSV